MFTARSLGRISLRKKRPKKKYDPLDTTMKLVDRSDDLDPVSSEDGGGGLRAEMSCGHAITPKSLTGWCRSKLDEGNYEFRCPALVEGTEQCNKPWTYQEVRRLADLSIKEMRHFEDTMARLAAADHGEIQSCPQCNTNMERKNPANLCVLCTICTADRKKNFLFCWQCQRQWKGRSPRLDRCDNDGCANKDLQVLQRCKTMSLPDVEGVTSCPSVRCCPTCGMRVEHNQQFCKNIACPRCHVEFCFVCLRVKRECCQTSSPYKICATGVAPRQTSIAIWKRK
ncbi:putative E3 ubiquitin-protein ligase ARI5 [Scophthalmus maximus]|uniref:Putative E3 ubiquitin-protein ligase ARI5 n=1 Tax=Scophthalmus maximus TaxID=52904 RepID=A0A2U9B0M7_SCOMX|nr:putative E3 ubiquitin-protein ligase ARI5 [Scophthalmus maximus]